MQNGYVGYAQEFANYKRNIIKKSGESQTFFEFFYGEIRKTWAQCCQFFICRPSYVEDYMIIIYAY